MWTYNNTDTLIHYGILGMKWGRRRTKEQLARARKSKGGSASNPKTTKESIKKMSDDELRRKLNRLQMEQQYAKLSGADVNRGKQCVDKIIKAGATAAAVTTTALTLYNNADKIRKIVDDIAKKKTRDQLSLF